MQRGRLIIYLFGIKWLPINWKLAIPEKMSELSGSQLLWWVEHVYLRIPELFSKTEDGLKVKDSEGWNALKLEMCKVLTDVPFWLFKSIDAESIRNLLYTWDISQFMYNEKYEPTENPVLKLGGYYGPVKAEYFTPWEFAFTDAFYLRYKQSKSIADLNLMLAQIYRPSGDQDSKYTQEVREAYDNEGDLTRLQRIGRAPLNKKLLALWWYEQWRGNLKKSYPHLFGSGNSEKSADSGSWLPVFMSAGNGIENFDKIKGMQLSILFAELNRIIKQRKDEQSN